MAMPLGFRETKARLLSARNTVHTGDFPVAAPTSKLASTDQLRLASSTSSFVSFLAPINIRHIQGRVRVLGNTVQTSPETVGDVDAVRLVNANSILMANNTVECKWPNAAGIQVFSPFAEWPTRHAVVEANDVLMSPGPGVSVGNYSAGISIRGFADSVVIRHNTIRGRARAALAMYSFRGGVPADNAFIDNRLDGFEAIQAPRNEKRRPKSP
jgi:hypothetical protein